MLLTITSRAEPATDLGFLLHKHPGRVQSFEVSSGLAHVFYPEATSHRCTAALLLEVDPIELVRSKRFGGNDVFALAQYVNDRPYAASSMLAVAMAKVLQDATFTEILGVDVSHRALQIATRRLRLERRSDRQRERVTLLQSSLTYRDDRLGGFDAAVLMEVIEHVDPPRLAALERTVFGHARPGTVIVTTPNVEHNVRYAHLPAGRMRHRDHRFEWTRSEFRHWAKPVAARYGYRVRYLPVGADDPEVGPPTQLAVFTRTDSTEGTT
ncbi:MAG: methyltransferase [Pseudonocardiaceae bacterium]